MAEMDAERDHWNEMVLARLKRGQTEVPEAQMPQPWEAHKAGWEAGRVIGVGAGFRTALDEVRYHADGTDFWDRLQEILTAIETEFPELMPATHTAAPGREGTDGGSGAFRATEVPQGSSESASA